MVLRSMKRTHPKRKFLSLYDGNSQGYLNTKFQREITTSCDVLNHPSQSCPAIAWNLVDVK